MNAEHAPPIPVGLRVTEAAHILRATIAEYRDRARECLQAAAWFRRHSMPLAEDAEMQMRASLLSDVRWMRRQLRRAGR